MTAPLPRRSAAGARRLRDRATAHADRELTAEFAAIAERFQPQGPLAEAWDAVRRATLDTLALSGLRGAESFRKHLTHVGYFFAWAAAQGARLDPATVCR